MKVFSALGRFVWWIIKNIVGLIVTNIIITIILIILVWKFVLPQTPDGYQPSVTDIKNAYQTFSDLSSGKIKLTPEQTQRLAPLESDIYNPVNLATALNIVDPVTFQNIDYWTQLFTKILPILKQYGAIQPQ
jgi:hypothetical protein